jgi:hypothetical protein
MARRNVAKIYLIKSLEFQPFLRLANLQAVKPCGTKPMTIWLLSHSLWASFA